MRWLSFLWASRHTVPSALEHPSRLLPPHLADSSSPKGLCPGLIASEEPSIPHAPKAHTAVLSGPDCLLTCPSELGLGHTHCVSP